MIMSSDEQRVMRSLDRIIQRERDLAVAAANAGQASARASRDATSEIDKMAQSMTRAVASMAPWGSAIDALRSGYETVAQVLERVIDRQKEAANQVRGSTGLEQLGQLAGGDPAKLRELTDEARRVFSMGAGRDMNEAAGLVFGIRSAGFADRETTDLAARLYGTVTDPAGAATAIATLRASMGEAETGDFQSILAKGITTARTSPGNLDAVLKAVSRSGGMARALGVSDEQLLAMFSTVATAAGTPEEGGTQLAALMTALGRHGLQGDALEHVRRISAEGVPIEEGRGRRKRTRMSHDVADVIKYLHSEQAFRAYSALAGDLDAVTARERELQSTPRELGAALIDAGSADPTIAVQRLGRRAGAAEQLSAEGMGQVRAIGEALLQERAASMRAEGWSEPMVQAEQWAGEWGLNNPRLAAMGAWFARLVTFGQSNAVDPNAEALQRLERIATNTEGPSGRILPGDLGTPGGR